MSISRQQPGRRGLVVSDLHLFARRSVGASALETCRSDLRSVELLVLNGDIFDFRWSTWPNHGATQTAALAWLSGLLSDLARCQVHYVLGNHDCLPPFREGLSALSRAQPRFHWHEHSLRLGPALFLHGDCSQNWMDAGRFHNYRQAWREDRQRSPWRALAYSWVDRLGLTHRAQQWHFPRTQTVRRIAYHLDHASPGWRNGLQDCYFGHTHLPFSNWSHDGIRFHNTGSAVRTMVFQPILFEIPCPAGEERTLP
jgi:UDP-2,3-diacylglucosamine pyrophosphatase LpxH